MERDEDMRGRESAVARRIRENGTIVSGERERAVTE